MIPVVANAGDRAKFGCWGRTIGGLGSLSGGLGGIGGSPDSPDVAGTDLLVLTAMMPMYRLGWFLLF